MRVYKSLYNIQEKYILSSEFIPANSSLNTKYKHIKGNSNPYQIQFFIFPTPGYFHYTFLMAAYVIPRVLHLPSHLNCWIWDNVEDEDYVGWWGGRCHGDFYEKTRKTVESPRGVAAKLRWITNLFGFFLFSMNFFLFIFSSSLWFALGHTPAKHETRQRRKHEEEKINARKW